MPAISHDCAVRTDDVRADDITPWNGQDFGFVGHDERRPLLLLSVRTRLAAVYRIAAATTENGPDAQCYRLAGGPVDYVYRCCCCRLGTLNCELWFGYLTNTRHLFLCETETGQCITTGTDRSASRRSVAVTRWWAVRVVVDCIAGQGAHNAHDIHIQMICVVIAGTTIVIINQ